MKTRFLLMIAWLLLAVPAFAATTYTYNGPAFTSGTDHVSVSFTVNAPLAPSTSYLSLTAAGVTSSSVSVVGPGGVLTGFVLPVTTFQIHTDAAGNIDSWFIFGGKNTLTGVAPTSTGTDWQAYTMNTMAFIPGTGVPGVNQSSLVTGHYNYDQATRITFYATCAGAPAGCTLAGNGQPYVGEYSGIINPANTSGSWWVVTTDNGSGGGPLPLALSGTLPAGVVGTVYSGALTATGGAAPYSWSATGVPSGLTFGADGSLSGIPDTAGSYTVQATVTDSVGATATASVPVSITNPAPVACSGTNAVITAYVARNPGFITVNGGLNLLDHLWTTNLNPGNTTFLGGLVNWYQTGLIVDYTGVADPAGCILTNLTVKPRVTISTTSLANGTAGVAYSAPVSVTWGVAPYTTTISGLPAGLSFNGVNITGVPTIIGVFNLTISAVDAVGVSTVKNLSLTIVDRAIVFAPVLPNATVGAAYAATLVASGGYGAFTYAATGLPPGLTLTGSSLNGVPTTAGTFSVSLTATDAVGVAQSVTTTLVVNPAPPGNFTIKDEGQGRITALGAGYLMVGTKKLIWNASTKITVNTPSGELHVIDGFVKVNMRVQWKGLRDNATNTVLTSQLEVN
ncbi:MAG: putative Ig domain-containing protein [Acidobacteria bacterium]|nr:putative Ig domain-containing protein [Acidobacteriota bacterium]MBI3425321.1 putative Ig domain-containing protein [Acidobacteriota bacterium]